MVCIDASDVEHELTQGERYLVTGEWERFVGVLVGDEPRAFFDRRFRACEGPEDKQRPTGQGGRV